MTACPSCTSADSVANGPNRHSGSRGYSSTLGPSTRSRRSPPGCKMMRDRPLTLSDDRNSDGILARSGHAKRERGAPEAVQKALSHDPRQRFARANAEGLKTMGALETLKETIGLIQKVDNIDLYRRMLDLQTQVHALIDENRALKETLSRREGLTFSKNAYWMGEDGPFCSPCWDGKATLVRLHLQKGFHPRCPNCGTHRPPILRRRLRPRSAGRRDRATCLGIDERARAHACRASEGVG
jgi:hypothetical protein